MTAKGHAMCDNASCDRFSAHACKACKVARYCGRECQREDWRARHRERCGTCASCEEKPTPSDARGRCHGLKKHYEFDLRLTGTNFLGGGSTTSTYACGRCGETIARTCANGVERVVSGPERCKALGIGREHCMDEKVLMELGHKILGKECVVVVPPKDVRERTGMDAQAVVDAIPEDAETIVIRALKGYCDDIPLTFPKKKYPKLRNLRIHDVEMKSLTLTKEFCPNLNVLETQNSLDNCAKSGRLKIVVPTLMELKMNHFRGPQGIIQDMIDAASLQLVKFDTYKLWIEAPDNADSSLRFHAPILRRLSLHRSDALTKLTLTAPFLRDLDLQACYELKDINFVPFPARVLDELGIPEEMRQIWSGPYGPQNLETLLHSSGLPSETLSLRVNIQHAIIGERALAELRKHPRIDSRDLVEKKDDTTSWMGSMQAHHKNMRLEMNKIMAQNPTMSDEEVLTRAFSVRQAEAAKMFNASSAASADAASAASSASFSPSASSSASASASDDDDVDVDECVAAAVADARARAEFQRSRAAADDDVD